MPENPNLAAQWKALSQQQRDSALSRMTPEQKHQLASSLGFMNPNVSVSASPPAMSPAGIKSKLTTARDAVVDNLPAVGGFVGGLIGAGAGAETGPGAVLTAATGAAAGGGLGEDVRQSLNEHFHPEDRKMGGGEAALRMLLASGSQGLQEVGGQVAGRVTGKALNAVGTKLIPEQVFQKYPVLKSLFAVNEKGASPRAAQHLTAAASNKQAAGVTLEAVTNTLGDLEQEITKLPPKERTVQGFLKSVNTRKDAMNLESGTAMLPIAGRKTVPIGVSDNVKKLVRSYMTNTPMGLNQRKYLMKRAAEFEKPWSFRQLDELRTDLATQLADHNTKGSVAKYVAEKGDLDLQIDNAVLDGLRDTVYPEMDRAAGKPAGYFEDLKGRQSSLITLQKVLDKRVKDLKGAQAVSEVAPRFSSENVSGSLHAGSMPRLGLYGIRQAVSPVRELKAASKHVAKAFPSVDSMPYQMLFSGEIRAANLKGPKTRELEEQRADQLTPQ